MMRPLSPKDATEFQSALQSYEKKDYKQSLKHVDAVLKRRKDHGESLCLRGLLRHSLNQPEAKESVVEGTRLQPTSSVAWHMSGIYFKQTKQYAEAFASYAKSFALNKDNPSVQQDLSMLAMQQREFGVLVQVRTQMLAARPSVKMVWSSLAVAHYLNGDGLSALKTLRLYEELVSHEAAAPQSDQDRIMQEIEESELALFKNTVVRSTHGAAAALQDLDEHESKIRDKLSVSERRAAYLADMGPSKKRNAIEAYHALIRRNPDDSRYYKSLRLVLGDAASDPARFWRDMETQYPTAALPKSRLLFCIEDPTEKVAKLREYVTSLLKRGTPAAFEFVKPLYPSEAAVMTKVLEGVDVASTRVGRLFWAKHLSYSGEQKKALAEIKKLFDEDSDTAEGSKATDDADVALVHAKLLQRAGDLVSAAHVLEKAAAADPGDRYLNTKAAKYALRAGLVDKGIELGLAFPIRGGYAKETEGAYKHAVELESVDLITRIAYAYQRTRDHGMALKRALEVVEIFEAYRREEFDFHFYGFKRGTLMAYLELCEWEDELFSHPRYLDAVSIVVAEAIQAATGSPDGSTEAERASAKRRRAKLLENGTVDPTKDADPFGQAALLHKDGLDNAFRVWKPLESARSTDSRTWELAFDLYLAQRKYVLAVQALKKAKSVAASREWIASAGARARYALETDKAAPDVLRSLQLKMLPGIANDGDIVHDDLVEYTDRWVASNRPLWAATRLFLGRLDSVAENDLINEIGSLTVVECELCVAELRKANLGTAFATEVLSVWPQASFPYLSGSTSV